MIGSVGFGRCEIRNSLDNIQATSIRERKNRKLYDDEHEANDLLRQYGDASTHVSEVYCPLRVGRWTSELRMPPGLALYLTTVDPDDGKTLGL